MKEEVVVILHPPSLLSSALLSFVENLAERGVLPAATSATARPRRPHSQDFDTADASPFGSFAHFVYCVCFVWPIEWR
jgi:hypothetical protein